MTSEPRRIAAHAAANYGGQLLPILIGLVLTPFMLRSLGPELYGIWAFVVAVQGLGGVLDFGLTSSVVKFVAGHGRDGGDDELSSIVASSFAIHLAIGTVLLVGFVLALLVLPPGSVDEQHDPVVRLALAVAAVSVAFGLPLGTLGSVLLGYRGYGAANVVNIVVSLASAAATVLALLVGAGPVVLVAIGGGSALVAHAAKAAWAARLRPGLVLRPRHVTPSMIRRIGGFSIWLFVVDTGRKIFYNLDAVLIAALLPITSVGLYNVAFKAASGIAYLAGPFVQVLFPAAASYAARDERARLRDLVVGGTRLSLVLTLPAVVWLVVLGPRILAAWVGPGYDDAVPALRVLSLVFLLGALQAPSAVLLRGIGEVRAIAAVVAAEYVVNIILTVTLLPVVGIVGAAIGTLVPQSISGLIVVPWLACRAVGVGYRTFLRRAVLPAVLVAVPTLLVLVAFDTLAVADAWPGVIAAGLLSVAVFGGLYLLTTASHAERAIARDTASSAARRLVARTRPS
ncbi:MAG TPA: flippase [Candidatus Limnocylindrales bacterium]|jgi:O-antigen/teichoic acid export membrane protein